MKLKLIDYIIHCWNYPHLKRLRYESDLANLMKNSTEIIFKILIPEELFDRFQKFKKCSLWILIEINILIIVMKSSWILCRNHPFGARLFLSII